GAGANFSEFFPTLTALWANLSTQAYGEAESTFADKQNSGSSAYFAGNNSVKYNDSSPFIFWPGGRANHSFYYNHTLEVPWNQSDASKDRNDLTNWPYLFRSFTGNDTRNFTHPRFHVPFACGVNLTIDTISFPATINKGTNITVTASIRNDGKGDGYLYANASLNSPYGFAYGVAPFPTTNATAEGTISRDGGTKTLSYLVNVPDDAGLCGQTIPITVGVNATTGYNRTANVTRSASSPAIACPVSPIEVRNEKVKNSTSGEAEGWGVPLWNFSVEVLDTNTTARVVTVELWIQTPNGTLLYNTTNVTPATWTYVNFDVVNDSANLRRFTRADIGAATYSFFVKNLSVTNATANRSFTVEKDDVRFEPLSNFSRGFNYSLNRSDTRFLADLSTTAEINTSLTLTTRLREENLTLAMPGVNGTLWATRDNSTFVSVAPLLLNASSQFTTAFNPDCNNQTGPQRWKVVISGTTGGAGRSASGEEAYIANDSATQGYHAATGGGMEYNMTVIGSLRFPSALDQSDTLVKQWDSVDITATLQDDCATEMNLTALGGNIRFLFSHNATPTVNFTCANTSTWSAAFPTNNVTRLGGSAYRCRLEPYTAAWTGAGLLRGLYDITVVANSSNYNNATLIAPQALTIITPPRLENATTNRSTDPWGYARNFSAILRDNPGDYVNLTAFASVGVNTYQVGSFNVSPGIAGLRYGFNWTYRCGASAAANQPLRFWFTASDNQSLNQPAVSGQPVNDTDTTQNDLAKYNTSAPTSGSDTFTLQKDVLRLDLSSGNDSTSTLGGSPDALLGVISVGLNNSSSISVAPPTVVFWVANKTGAGDAAFLQVGTNSTPFSANHTDAFDPDTDEPTPAWTGGLKKWKANVTSSDPCYSPNESRNPFAADGSPSADGLFNVTVVSPAAGVEFRQARLGNHFSGASSGLADGWGTNWNFSVEVNDLNGTVNRTVTVQLELGTASNGSRILGSVNLTPDSSGRWWANDSASFPNSLGNTSNVTFLDSDWARVNFTVSNASVNHTSLRPADVGVSTFRFLLFNGTSHASASVKNQSANASFTIEKDDVVFELCGNCTGEIVNRSLPLTTVLNLSLRIRDENGSIIGNSSFVDFFVNVSPGTYNKYNNYTFPADAGLSH
ncbi:MAG: hypothetical protein QXQ87_07205, partial [Halobacteria archaeon]